VAPPPSQTVPPSLCSSNSPLLFFDLLTLPFPSTFVFFRTVGFTPYHFVAQTLPDLKVPSPETVSEFRKFRALRYFPLDSQKIRSFPPVEFLSLLPQLLFQFRRTEFIRFSCFLFFLHFSCRRSPLFIISLPSVRQILPYFTYSLCFLLGKETRFYPSKSFKEAYLRPSCCPVPGSFSSIAQFTPPAPFPFSSLCFFFFFVVDGWSRNAQSSPQRFSPTCFLGGLPNCPIAYLAFLPPWPGTLDVLVRTVAPAGVIRFFGHLHFFVFVPTDCSPNVRAGSPSAFLRLIGISIPPFSRETFPL